MRRPSGGRIGDVDLVSASADPDPCVRSELSPRCSEASYLHVRMVRRERRDVVRVAGENERGAMQDGLGHDQCVNRRVRDACGGQKPAGLARYSLGSRRHFIDGVQHPIGPRVAGPTARGLGDDNGWHDDKRVLPQRTLHDLARSRLVGGERKYRAAVEDQPGHASASTSRRT